MDKGCNCREMTIEEMCAEERKSIEVIKARTSKPTYIMAELLDKNKKAQEDEKYKIAYCDGVLDFYNAIKERTNERN